MQQPIPTVLQVEDEVNIRKLITVNLAHRGYRVVEASNGRYSLPQTTRHRQLYYRFFPKGTMCAARKKLIIVSTGI